MKRIRSIRCPNRASRASAQAGVLFAATLLSATVAVASPKSFPGAYGFGATAAGGRGGIVIDVTNLNDSGPGSLRACVEAKPPRTCIFRIGGTIALEKTLDIKVGRLTVAGQTAPGDGIQLRLSPSSAEGGALVSISADDVVLSHLRLRRGPTSLARRPGGTCCGDVLSVIRANRVMLDHLSLAYGTDELLNVSRSRNVTVQNSILSYALRYSTDKDTLSTGKSHSKGLLSGYGSDRISFLNNLVAFVEGRGCRFKSGKANECSGNLFYGMAHNEVQLSDGAKLDLVANRFQRPPKGLDGARAIIETRGSAAVYARNNVVPQDRQLWGKRAQSLSRSVANHGAAAKLRADRVVSQAGAQPRDALDRRIVGDIAAGKSRYIDHPAEAGGWPKTASTRPYADVDKDGMDDAWETKHGLLAGNSRDGNKDANKDGYTNLENFLVDLANGYEAPKRASRQSDPVKSPSDLGKVTSTPTSSAELKSLRQAYKAAKRELADHKKLKKDYRRRGEHDTWKVKVRALQKKLRTARDAYRQARNEVG